MNVDSLYQQKLSERSFIDVPPNSMPPGQQPSQMAQVSLSQSQQQAPQFSQQQAPQFSQQQSPFSPQQSPFSQSSTQFTAPSSQFTAPSSQLQQPTFPTTAPQSQPFVSQPPHPTVLAMFLSLTPEAQQRFSIANPMAYAQLCIAAQQQFQLQSAAQQPQSALTALNALTAPSTAQDNNPTEDISKKKRSKRVKDKDHKDKDKDKAKEQKPVKPAYSESDNFHSSDEELNVKPKPINTPHSSSNSSKSYIRLPLDFRNNLCEINDNGYSLRWPRQYRSVRSIELVDCTINRSPVLDKEPYIYISIQEIPGDFILTGGTESVFGKLIPEKTVNEFIFYKPENCRKSFTKPVNLDKITISFLQYDQTDISLSKLDIRNLSQSSTGGYYKLNTRGSHYLTTGDLVSIMYKQPNRTTVETITVLDTPAPDVLILEVPIKDLKTEDRCTFEKVQLKCSLTFKIQCA
jgi:hypothetical protein